MKDTPIKTPCAVIDASALLAYLFIDEHPTQALDEVFERVIDKKMILYAPRLLAYEIGNALHMAVKRSRIHKKGAEDLMLAFQELPLTYKDIDLAATFALCQKYGLSFYDASYVYLSSVYKCQLFTEDKRLLSLQKSEI